MADLEARREARRRKILQSTEDRMNRVLGRQNDSNTERDPEPTKSQETENFQSTENNIDRPVVEADCSEQNSSLRQRTVPASNSTNINSRDGPTAKNTVRVSPLKRPQTLQNKTDQNESLNSSKSSSEAKMMLKHFEFLRIVLCFMTAFLCRRVLASGYGIFYVQSIMLPFMCLEAGFFMFKKKMLHNVILPHRSSMLIGLLMLCGIKPAILQMYNKVMGYVTAASEDFAMFFFAFMFAHLFVS